MQNFEINSTQIDKIKKITTEEKSFRIKNLEFFKATGFPNKRFEDWKFTDFQNIIDSNFEKLDVKRVSTDISKIDLIKDFEFQPKTGIENVINEFVNCIIPSSCI